jgi:hypothetical protein
MRDGKIGLTTMKKVDRFISMDLDVLNLFYWAMVSEMKQRMDHSLFYYEQEILDAIRYKLSAWTSKEVARWMEDNRPEWSK